MCAWQLLRVGLREVQAMERQRMQGWQRARGEACLRTRRCLPGKPVKWASFVAVGARCLPGATVCDPSLSCFTCTLLSVRP